MSYFDDVIEPRILKGTYYITEKRKMNKTKDNSGTLSENERKEKDTHPDKNGKCSIVCKFCQQENKMWLSAWEKVGQFGNFLSLAFKHMEDKAVTKPDPQAPDLTDDDSTVPF